MKQHAMTPRPIMKLLIAACMLVLGLSGMPAQAAAHHKHHARAVHKKIPAVPPKPVAARKPAVPARSLAIISKAPNDAPDFDFQDRIQEAQALIAKQPVLKDDMQVDADGKLAHFVWTLAVGQKTGPLTVVRMDETGKNDQDFTAPCPVDNFLKTTFPVE